MRQRYAVVAFFLSIFGAWNISRADLPMAGALKCFNMTQPIACGNKDFPRQEGDFAHPLNMNRFKILQQNAVVLDQQTQLIWMQCSLGAEYHAPHCSEAQPMTWGAAQQACVALQLDHRHWRLPTVMELNALLMVHQSGIKIAQAIFPDTYAASYWAANDGLTAQVQVISTASAEAWHVNFANAAIFDAKKNTAFYVRCVSDH
ncbi:MAG: DUF1566 domain-containing protein [Methylococcaceae bacterium]|nr:DUF1566 domain-containing protein [Methylococcaceae bacterium]